MIAGWPGMGSVALGVVDYLRKYLDTVKFAEIQIDPLTVIDSVEVENGVAALPGAPRNCFYYSKRFNLIIFEGESQIQGLAGIELANNALTVAERYEVSSIYTGAAFPLPVGYKDPVDVYAVANKEVLRDTITQQGMKIMEGGHISGLNGLLLGFSEKRAIDALCLLATMPQYAIGIPNPKASGAIIDTLSRILNFRVDMHELNEYIKDMDEKMAAIEDKVKDAFTLGNEQPDPRSAKKKIPEYVMERIEKLFKEAGLDKKKAVILKRELDRWDLYKMYEDRFLDLFKENQ
jgi:proteasome assembly chaperone (PAC2) family protein